MHGPVLRPFAYDEAHPYDAGEHRGIDIGADAGGSVAAPAAGTVSFAGTVPTSGKSVTIETSDGYSVTLTHLGSTVVSKGAAVGEGDTIGAVGPSGTPEVAGPYVHLGIRLTADENGYLDPLTLLPAATTESPPADNDSPTAQPIASGGATAPAPVAQPAPAPASSASAPPASTASPASTPGTNVQPRRPRVSHRARGRAQETRSEPRSHRSLQRPAAHPATRVRSRAQPRVRRPDQHLTEPARSPSHPVVEAAVPREPIDLPAGQELRSSVHVARRPRTALHGRASGALLPLLCNWAAALIAVGAALAAARRRRGHLGRRPVAGAQILQLPREAFDSPQREAA